MDEQRKPEAAQPMPRRFQFGMKVFFSLPIVVAVFFAIAAYVGFELAAVLMVLAGIVGCLPRPATRPIAGWLGLALVPLVPLMLISSCNRLLVPAIMESECNHNVRMISMALRGYHDTHGCFPPAYIADENGQPMHSWRVLILPYLERSDIYNAYDFTEPWDGPNNSKLAAPMPYYFQCIFEPSRPTTQTSFVAVIGPDAAWSGSRPVSLDDFTDDPSETLHVVEIANSGIHWMEPRDLNVSEMTLEVNPKSGRGISSLHTAYRWPRHPGSANVAFADGRERLLWENTSAKELRAMLTRSGGEPVDLEDF